MTQREALDRTSSEAIARIAVMCTDIGEELDRLSGRPSSPDSGRTPRGPDLVRGEPVDTSHVDPRRPPAASAAGDASARGTVVVLPKVLRLDRNTFVGSPTGGMAHNAALLLAGIVLSTAGTRCARRVLARWPRR